MESRDLRKWIATLENEGLLKRITAEVNWDIEIGAITRKVLREGGPALLFENIKDHKDTWSKKILVSGLGSRERVALSLNVDRSANDEVLTKVMKDRLEKTIDPIVVDSGPVKDNIIAKKEVDLLQFPVPRFHHLDGGRYINTMSSIVTRNPDSGYHNVGIYRGMITEKDKIGVLLASNQHWGMHFAKHRAMGKPMPVACVIGWDPCLSIVASMGIQHGDKPFGEYEFCGNLRSAPVELVKCETSDIMVPASAEIVIEGFISPDPKDFVMEGPFGEYPGYYGGAKSPKPAIEVECITFRNDPILRGCLEGSTPGAWSEDAHWLGPGFSAAVWNVLEKAGVPNVLDVWCSPICVGTILRVRIDKIYRGHAKQVANAVWGSTVANYLGKFVIVVDEDIDIRDPEAMDWALAFRVNPDMDQLITFPGCVGSMLDPSTPLSLRDVPKYGQGKWTRVLIDATKNWELEREEQYGGEIFPPIATKISPEMEELINKRWKEYGF